MDFNREEITALNQAVVFIRKSQYWKQTGEDAYNIYPMCQNLMRVRFKIEEMLKKQTQETLRHMESKVSATESAKPVGQTNKQKKMG